MNRFRLEVHCSIRSAKILAIASWISIVWPARVNFSFCWSPPQIDGWNSAHFPAPSVSVIIDNVFQSVWVYLHRRQPILWFTLRRCAKFVWHSPPSKVHWFSFERFVLFEPLWSFHIPAQSLRDSAVSSWENLFSQLYEPTCHNEDLRYSRIEPVMMWNRSCVYATANLVFCEWERNDWDCW